MWHPFSLGRRRNGCGHTRGALSGYVDERLPQKETERVQEHLSECAGCREELESLRATVQLLHRVPQVPPPRSFAVAEARPVPGWSAVWVLRVATAVVAVFLLLTVVFDAANVFEGPQRGVLNERGEQSAEMFIPGGGEEGGTTSTEEAGWVRPLEYGLLGVVVVLGGGTLAYWRSTKRRESASLG